MLTKIFIVGYSAKKVISYFWVNIKNYLIIFGPKSKDYFAEKNVLSQFYMIYRHTVLPNKILTPGENDSRIIKYSIVNSIF